MIVIIKPSKKCNYRNVVDILDEMAIVDVPTYAIVNEFTPEETKLLEGKLDFFLSPNNLIITKYEIKFIK